MPSVCLNWANNRTIDAWLDASNESGKKIRAMDDACELSMGDMLDICKRNGISCTPQSCMTLH